MTDSYPFLDFFFTLLRLSSFRVSFVGAACVPPLLSSQGEREEHVFGQGFWIALRLDLIQWFMPLPIAGTAGIATDDYEAEMSSATPPGENSRHGATAAASSAATTSTPLTTQRTRADVSEPTEDPEEANILKLVESVSVRASVRGLALATWRGADNRDGFALDIDRLVDSLCHARVLGFLVPLQRACVEVGFR